MKKRFVALLLGLLLLLSAFGCSRKQTVPTGSLVGTWKDSYGLTEYKFESSGKMKIEALSLGSCSGTYAVNGDKITICYRVFVKDVKDTYTLRLDGNTMYLDENKFTRKK